jgi:transcription elongation factor GreB
MSKAFRPSDDESGLKLEAEIDSAIESGLRDPNDREDLLGDDSDSDSDDDLDNDSGGGAASSGRGAIRSRKNYITPNGFSKLRAEVDLLLKVERPKVVETVAWAASNGDRSENADYIYGKRRLREIDKRLRFLQKRLDAAEVVTPELQSGERVLFGATVAVRNENDELKTYHIIGSDETDIARGRISWSSPIGSALLQTRVGDSVTVRTPKGSEELEIEEIKYIKLDD